MRVARLINLLLSGLLAGNEFASLVATHPALHTLPPLARLQAEQAVYRRLGRYMPAFIVATLASFLPPLAAERDRRAPAFRATLAGLACHLAMFAITLTGNIPLSRRLVALPPAESSDAEFLALRARWDRLHRARNALNIAGFLCAALGALASDRGK